MAARLTAAQAERFGGHIMLAEIGGAGQAALRRASVLIIGMGGLGNPLAEALGGAGIGRLGLVDGDQIAASNLHRQFLFAPQDIGRPKAETAREKLAHQFPDTQFAAYGQRLTTPHHIKTRAAPYDIIADCSDNFTTRYLVSDMCAELSKPYISAAATRFAAQIGNFQPYRQDANGAPYASYRCLAPHADDPDTPCAAQGVLGAFTAMVGAMQALEIIREITGAGQTLCGKLQIIDGLSGMVRIVDLPHDASARR